jgi:hypothetical protein
MQNIEAVEQMWEALVNVAHYFQFGIPRELESTTSFGAENAKPLVSAYKTFDKVKPYLSKELTKAVQSALVTAQDGFNDFLDALRDVISVPPGPERENQTRRASGVLNRSLQKYRSKLEKVELLISLQEKGNLSVPPEGIVINNISGEQIGAIALRAINMTSTQAGTQIEKTVNLTQLADDLSRLRQAMKREAPGTERDIAIDEIARAEQAARAEDIPKVTEHLRSAGKWTLDVATKIGAAVAVEALNKAMGL